MKLNQQQVQHLLLRSGFGDNFRVVQKYVNRSPEDIFDNQLNLATQSFREIKTDATILPHDQMKALSREQRKEMIKEGLEDVRKMNTQWIHEMTHGQSGMLDKMAFFWHDHFACKAREPVFMAQYLQQLRKHALGNFGEMLRAVSKSAAMLQYLNNQQNRKMAPNENFAREVMELFTLGRDHQYSEHDISEAARAFTGWGFDKSGSFIFREKFHDTESKTVLGKTGNLTGDDVIDLLLEKKQTAQYISEKLVKYFVNPLGNDDLQKQVADDFYKSNYSIPVALKTMFTSPAFFESGNIARRIKSPIELIVTLQRQLFVDIDDVKTLIFLQRNLGQMLFDPPNVAGWPDGEDWVDSATLMLRLMLPQYIFKAAIIQSQAGDSFDDNDQFKVGGPVRKLKAHVDFESLEKSMAHTNDSQIGEFLIQGSKVTLPSSGGSFIDKIVHYTSKPAYQLC